MDLKFAVVESAEPALAWTDRRAPPRAILCHREPLDGDRMQLVRKTASQPRRAVSSPPDVLYLWVEVPRLEGHDLLLTSFRRREVTYIAATDRASWLRLWGCGRVRTASIMDTPALRGARFPRFWPGRKRNARARSVGCPVTEGESGRRAIGQRPAGGLQTRGRGVSLSFIKPQPRSPVDHPRKKLPETANWACRLSMFRFLFNHIGFGRELAPLT